MTNRVIQSVAAQLNKNQSQTSLNKLKGVGMSFSLHLESGYRERTAHDFILPRFGRTLSAKNS